MVKRVRVVLLPGMLLLAVAGCRTVEALKRRCAEGDATACERACSKGVAGTGGCFDAAEILRRRAPLDHGSEIWGRALGYHRKSCDGGYGDGCLHAAQMLEAPYGPGSFEAAEGEAVTMMTDADIEGREQLLERGCALGDQRSCRRLGDVLLGKRASKARAAYEKACRSSSAVEECARTHRDWVERAEALRRRCTRRLADDCSDLGNLIFRVDVPRAMRLFAGEYALRGLEPVVGALPTFLRDRVREAKDWTEPAAPQQPSARSAASREASAPAPTPQATSAGEPTLRFGMPVVRGRAARTSIERVVKQSEEPLLDCYRGMLEREPGLEGQVTMRFVVDLTGDVWRPVAEGEVARAGFARCLERVFSAMQVPPPVDAAVVEYPLAFELPEDNSRTAR